jgi:hypothetical protein
MSLYQHLVEKRNDSEELKTCKEDVVCKFLSKETDVDHPGMLLGKIQSGKTRAFIGVIARAFEKPTCWAGQK